MFNIRAAAPGYYYASSKCYTHSVGLSCCFRQWRAESHCRFLHGYALKVECVFVHNQLDLRNWVVDFGSLKSFRGWLEDTFDHKTLVAEDDPLMSSFLEMRSAGMIDMVIVPATGCESMARIVYEYLEQWLKDNGYNELILGSVRVWEHEANFAEYGKKELGD